MANFKAQDYQQQSTDLDTSTNLQYSNNGPERVKVSVRLRPFIDDEINSKDRSICVEHMDTDRGLIVVKKDFEKRQFQFDYLFDPKSSQIQIYQRMAKPVIESVVKGVNGTIFCYGQTGTGKTYTMMGNPDSEDRGITPRALEQVFCDIAKDSKNSYQVQISYMQIYMEMLLDLINPENNEVKIRESPDSGVFVSGLEWVGVDGPLECLRVLSYAEKNRIVAFTNLNAHSSRSHSILMVRVERKPKSLVSSSNSNEKSCSNSRNTQLGKIQFSQNNSQGNVSINSKRQIRSQGGIHSQDNLSQYNNFDDNYQQQKYSIDDDSRLQASSQVVLSATLYLVDLAGSERVKKSRATGDRLNEARAINYSLTALGKCIHALTDPKTTFVPFRDSKLTRILQDALGGNCKTALVVNIGPSMKHAEETISSLSFGMRAMKVQNMPIVNLIQSKDQLFLQQEMDNKSGLIDRLQTSQHRLVQQVQQLEKEVIDLKQGQQLNLSCDVSVESQYKNQIAKIEEDHKSFLEEIDHMMIDQEAENDSLKKQLIEISEQCQKFESENEQAISYKNELLQVIQELHQIIDQKDNDLIESQNILVLLQKENQSIQDEQRTFQDQQSILLSDNSLRAFAAQDALRTSKERQINEFRHETEMLSVKYARLLEDKRRVECNLEDQQSMKQQNQIQIEIVQLKATISEIQNNLNDKQVLVMTKDSELTTYKEGEKKLRRQLEELKQRSSEMNTQHEQELQSLNQSFSRERSNFDKEKQISILNFKDKQDESLQLKLDLEDVASKLNQMHTEYINLSQDRDGQINTQKDLNRRLEVTFGLEVQYKDHIDELQIQLQKIHNQFFEIKKVSDHNINSLKEKDIQIQDLTYQMNMNQKHLIDTLKEQSYIKGQIALHSETNQDLEKQLIQQQEQLFEYEQQINQYLSKDIKFSELQDENLNLQILVSNLKNQNEQLSTIRDKTSYLSTFQLDDQSEEQNFQINSFEMKRSIALSGIHLQEGAIILELQLKIAQNEDDIKKYQNQESLFNKSIESLTLDYERLSDTKQQLEQQFTTQLNEKDIKLRQKQQELEIVNQNQQLLTQQLDERLKFIDDVCQELKGMEQEKLLNAQEDLNKDLSMKKLSSHLRDQDFQLKDQAQLINKQQDKLYEQYEMIEHLNRDLLFLNNKVTQQSQQLSVLSMKSQKAVLKMEDVVLNEVVRGVLESIVMKVEFNLLENLDESMHQSQLFYTCQTPVNRPGMGLFTATGRNGPSNQMYSIKSHVSSVDQKSLAKFQIDFEESDLKGRDSKERESLQKTLHQQLVESLFIEEEDQEEDDDAQSNQAEVLLGYRNSQQICSKGNMAIIEQSDESMESIEDNLMQTPALKNSFSSIGRQYQSEPNDQKSAFQMPSFFERSSFKNNVQESDLLNQLVSLAQSNQHFSLTQSKKTKNNESLYSFSDKQSAFNNELNSFHIEDNDLEVKQVLERVLFIVEANLTFQEDLEQQISCEQLSMIGCSNPPSEIVSMKGSLVNDISFQLNLESCLVDKFMTKVKQRQFNLMENFDLSLGSIQQAISNSKQQQQFKSDITKALSDDKKSQFTLRSQRSSLKDVSNDENLPQRELSSVFQKLDDGVYDKNTLIKIIVKLLDCAEQTHNQFVGSLMKKAKNLIVVDEQEELIRMMAMIMIDKQKQLNQPKGSRVCSCDYKHEITTQKIQRFVKTLQEEDSQASTCQKQFSPKMVRSESCHEITKQEQREAVLLVQKSIVEFTKMAGYLNNQYIQ